MAEHLYVIKRDGSREPVSFNEILERIRKLSDGLDHVNPDLVAQKVCMQLTDGVKTSELDEFAAETCAMMQSRYHPNYGLLAARILIDNHHKNTPSTILECVEELYHDQVIVCDEYHDLVCKHRDQYQAMIDYTRDFMFDYFGFKTLERAYLLKKNGKIVERPQHMWMRVSIQLHGDNFERVKETYDALSQGYFIHATPTLFNSGTNHPQLSSCFIAGTKVHTLSGIKNIEDVIIGDKVVTHTGSVKDVTQLHTNILGNRELFDIKIAGTPTLTVTGNHRLWSISEEQLKWGKLPTWNRVDYLRTGDWIAIPRKTTEDADYILDVKPYLDNIIGDGDNIKYGYEYRDNKVYPKYYYTTKQTEGLRFHTKTGIPFNRFWKLTNSAMELLGMWYGDGSVSHSKNSSGKSVPRNVNIVSHSNNKILIEFVKDQFKELLDIEHITEHVDTHGMVSIIVNNTIIAQLFSEIFKCKFDGKRIPVVFNELSYEKIKYFLAGLVSTDGCVSKENSITIQLTNPELMSQIFHLSRSVGIPVTLAIMTCDGKKSTGRMSVPTNIMNGIVKKYYNDDRLDSLSEKKGWNRVIEINGTTFMRLDGKEYSNKHPEFVYTLGVEDDHSYSVGGIIAENCFLLTMDSDSIQGIYKTLGDCAMISKWAGGIGLAVHNIRARGSRIAGTNGEATGLVPMLKVFNDTAKYVNQGGKRNGSFAIYLEPWHADIEEFLKLKLNQGAEEDRARDLFYGLWIPDLFMKRVESDGQWTLMCPHECPGLSDCYGEKFEELYAKYESEGKGRKSIPAKKIWQMILDAQIQTGTPYLCYKDAANSKSNQQHLGTIKSSNLCTEIMEYTSKDESAVCNLGSLALPKFVEDGAFNFEKLREYTRILTRNLDIVIDKNFYPTEECRNSNMRHRPIGIGIQGLADVFAKLKLPWTSKEANNLNREIFENIYFAALQESVEQSYSRGNYIHSIHEVRGGEFPTFKGSPISDGKLQCDLWNSKPVTDYLDWDNLRRKCKELGVRNSLLVAPMPTASTSQILGNNECFEPFTSNLYTRRVLAGDFMVVNKYLVDDLTKLGLWTSDVRSQIIANNGSIQGISEIPENLRAVYKTVWEIPQKTLIDMAADRAPFICQSQSLNLFLAEPTYAKISSMHMYAWKKGLKTGCYYLRTKAVASAQKFTVEPPASNNCLTCSA